MGRTRLEREKETLPKKMFQASDALTRGQRQKGRARGHASRDADRASEALPSANTRQQEADPGQARDEPGCASNATWLRFAWRASGHGQSLLPEAGPCLRVPRKGRARAKRAMSQFPVESAAEDAQHSREKRVSKRRTQVLPVSECGIPRTLLSAWAVCRRWHVVRLTPGARREP